MYLRFFGLLEKPFNATPDPRFLYMSPGHREALAQLYYGTQQRKGFIVLTGQVGTGKTTLLHALRQRLDGQTAVSFIFTSTLPFDDILEYVLADLGIAKRQESKAQRIIALNDFLIERERAGQNTVLIVDEAQNLSGEMLEEIRMLSNLETPERKLLQIMLVGQPELADKLSQPALRQLRQRVELRHAIRPLQPDETASYIRERLLVAGHAKGDLFTGAAERAVHRFARGIPRVINVLCDNALIAAFSRDAAQVSAKLVEEVASELGLSAGPGGPHFVRERSTAEPRARRRWLGRLWRRGDASSRPEL